MPNRHRGEIEAEFGGARRSLVLTLGALAELEAAFGADDLVALAERFGSGRMKARDLVRIIGAGLRGAGASISDDEVAAMTVPGGAAGFVRIATDLLGATFGEGGSQTDCAGASQAVCDGDTKGARTNPPVPQDAAPA